MAAQSSDVEILVHVAAPSRLSDDATYRRLAHAYLAFQPDPDTTFGIVPGPPSPPSDNLDAPLAAQRFRAECECPGAAESSTPARLVPAAQLSFGPDSQDLSFQSAIDNNSSPRLRPSAPAAAPAAAAAAAAATTTITTTTTRAVEAEAAALSQSSWQTPPSQVPDSYPLPGASIITVSPARVLQRFLQQPLAAGSLSREDHDDDGVDQPSPGASIAVLDIPSSLALSAVKQAAPAHGQQEPEQHLAADVIPVTPVAIPPGGLRKREASPSQHEQHAELSCLDVTHISCSFASQQPSSPPRAAAASEPPANKIPKRSHHAVQDDADAADAAAHPLRVLTDGDAVLLESSYPSAAGSAANSLRITPPSPPASVADMDPASLVSPKLDKLARDLSSRYRPVARRHIDPFERGFWLVDCTSWTDTVRHDTWLFLATYLHSGRAGWGVWCRRDDRHHWIRLYCWGHLAKHTYLLLYLASGRQIKAAGAKWLDSGGDVVLEAGGAA
ncbi:uncharacterized protein UV8b_02436 [Ustilaginoidea virens]|uniref:Uncharacterized protein n=1 Tax=Ustilaginoidea virens TaxID=1159556 RepID=A0A1B5L0K0_USTVR|nr:uncharacterized protein UV8b_02436 [Ustilaginoidea virens]QUC18195.1 hypothetical protein UV8b_02436 [Ustilaginoidea virens]GAO15928.1 hypothetical protein UVI_02039510 [Ustilaginoidea virens]